MISGVVRRVILDGDIRRHRRAWHKLTRKIPGSTPLSLKFAYLQAIIQLSGLNTPPNSQNPKLKYVFVG